MKLGEAIKTQRTPIKTMNLKEVQVVAAEGTEFGVIDGEVPGLLIIVVKHPGAKDWPYPDLKPTSGINKIEDCMRRYSVTPSS